ncbi:cytochrome c [Deinococcus sp.]|uniref:c-type cytochrome n=1 Tax=Deinococcus sp. TaxID=47478 RepID=UPI0025BA58F8|nr:cytochrome c [Deinococcus sp.]
MASKRREFSLLPTLLLSLVIGTVLGVLLLLLFGRHVGNPDTVSAVNAGIPGTTVIDRNENTGNKAANSSADTASTTNTASTTTAADGTATASGTPATAAATGTATADNASKTPVEGQAAAGSAGAAATAAALPQEQTVTDTSFQGTGAEIYVQACQSCHMPGGKGAKGAGIYPALANNPKLKAMQYPTGMVLYGNGGMPSFGHYMNDQQISEVVNYIRTELNNNTDKVTPDDVKKMRQPGQHYMIFGEAAG